MSQATDDCRSEILGRIRAALDKGRAELGSTQEPASPGHATPGRTAGLSSPQARIDHFRARLESVGGTCALASTEAEAASALLTVLREWDVKRLAVSDADLVGRLTESIDRGAIDVLVDADRDALLDADAGFSTAQWGIAETGTLVLSSAAERHRLVSLVPTRHVALLRTSAILEGLGEALATVRKDDHPGLPNAITFITGPSRTGDIELTLVVGVHGPKALHVILLEDHST